MDTQLAPDLKKKLSEPRINIDPQMKYISQNNRIYLLTENDDIKIYDSKSMYNSNYHPLDGTDILNANSLFEKISELQNDLKTRGENSIVWNGKDSSNKLVSSGEYFYQLMNAGKILQSRKMLILK